MINIIKMTEGKECCYCCCCFSLSLSFE